MRRGEHRDGGWWRRGMELLLLEGREGRSGAEGWGGEGGRGSGAGITKGETSCVQPVISDGVVPGRGWLARVLAPRAAAASLHAGPAPPWRARAGGSTRSLLPVCGKADSSTCPAARSLTWQHAAALRNVRAAGVETRRRRLASPDLLLHANGLVPLLETYRH